MLAVLLLLCSISLQAGDVTLLRPENGSADQPTTVVLRWNQHPQADAYSLSLASNKDFSPALRYLGIQDTSLTLTGLETGTTYYWRVSAHLQDSTIATSAVWSFITTSATAVLAAPQVVFPGNGQTSLPVFLTLIWTHSPGADRYALELSTSADMSPAVYFQNIGDSTKSLANLQENTEYYWRVRAQNDSLASPWSATWTFRTEQNYPQTRVLLDTIPFPSGAQGYQYKSADYKLIGLPGDVDLPLDSVLTGPYGTEWRAFEDTGAEDNFLREHNTATPLRFRRGKGFWLVHRGEVIIREVVKTAPLNAAGTTSIPLQQGWNIITNPFHRAIPWRAVQLSNDMVTPLWKYNRTFAYSDVLEPFMGYYFFNSDSLDSLKIPYYPVPGALQAEDERPRTGLRITLHTRDGLQDSVFINFSDRDPGEQIAKPWAGLLRAGVHIVLPDEAAGRNRYLASLTSPTPGKGPGHTFQVSSGQEAYTLTFDFPARDMAEMSFDLLHKATGTVYRITPGSRVSLPGASQADLFRLIFSETQQHAQTPPQEPRLVNFPNPFNPATRLDISLPQPEPVVLRIHDAAGRLVRELYSGELPAGTHRFVWDGRGRAGAAVASGVYFARLSTASGQAVVRKMILLR